MQFLNFREVWKIYESCRLLRMKDEMRINSWNDFKTSSLFIQEKLCYQLLSDVLIWHGNIINVVCCTGCGSQLSFLLLGRICIHWSVRFHVSASTFYFWEYPKKNEKHWTSKNQIHDFTYVYDNTCSRNEMFTSIWKVNFWVIFHDFANSKS